MSESESESESYSIMKIYDHGVLSPPLIHITLTGKRQIIFSIMLFSIIKSVAIILKQAFCLKRLLMCSHGNAFRFTSAL